MGPEDDRRREIRALLVECGMCSTLRLAHELQLAPESVEEALAEMEEVESVDETRDGRLWRLRRRSHGPDPERFLNGISP